MSDAVGTNQLLIAGRSKRSPRKLALLNTAIGLFAARGYHAVTIRDIGDEMGMTSASLYRHYKSKEALLADVIDLVIRPLLDEVRSIKTQELPALDRLRAAVSFHAGFALEHRTYLRVYYTEARQLSPENRASHRRLADRYRDVWAELLIEAGAAGSREEARTLYSMTMAMLNLGSNHDPRPGSQASLEWLVRRTMAMLLAGGPASLSRG